MDRRDAFPVHGWGVKVERVKIIDIHPDDAHYGQRSELVDRTGTFSPETETRPGYFSGRFIYDGSGRGNYFFAVKVKAHRRKVERR
jgi:hypothetical protein